MNQESQRKWMVVTLRTSLIPKEPPMRHHWQFLLQLQKSLHLQPWRKPLRNQGKRTLPEQKYYLMVRHRCAVLNSLRGKKTSKLLSYSTILYSKTKPKKVDTKSLWHPAQRFLFSATGYLSKSANWILPTTESRRHSKKKLKTEFEQGCSQITSGLRKELRYWVMTTRNSLMVYTEMQFKFSAIPANIDF